MLWACAINESQSSFLPTNNGPLDHDVTPFSLVLPQCWVAHPRLISHLYNTHNNDLLPLCQWEHLAPPPYHFYALWSPRLQHKYLLYNTYTKGLNHFAHSCVIIFFFKLYTCVSFDVSFWNNFFFFHCGVNLGINTLCK